ncbi:hypothetical protein [Roseovarius aestuariivivens]|uniref:hypothetical protein n=1 Tax=Roseovarius aestuariivivens TaxID=1888910 RepID=UPI001081104B|nr:hypothetical protein [Roseovarius aestuariivivens]
MSEDLIARGWASFPSEPAVLAWAENARHHARQSVADPDQQQGLVCEGTWFVGVDALQNDSSGRLPDGPPLDGAAWQTACALYGTLPLHKGQVSVIYPGYPRPRAGESEAAFGYRLRRDAAHVDGLLASGPGKRRYLLERHAYILGLPLTASGAGASPLSIWEGSHHIMRRAFEAALGGTDTADWDKVDLTEIYKATRREVFESCPRRLLTAAPGEAYLVHRLALHGVAPWDDGAEAPDDGRMIAYFRPEWPETGAQWLTAP